MLQSRRVTALQQPSSECPKDIHPSVIESKEKSLTTSIQYFMIIATKTKYQKRLSGRQQQQQPAEKLEDKKS
jgi:hypothetical protein